MKKLYCVICSKYLSISYLLQKILVLSKICSKCKNGGEKIFKEEESIEIFTVIGLTNNIEGFQKI